MTCKSTKNERNRDLARGERAARPGTRTRRTGTQPPPERAFCCPSRCPARRPAACASSRRKVTRRVTRTYLGCSFIYAQCKSNYIPSRNSPLPGAAACASNRRKVTRRVTRTYTGCSFIYAQCKSNYIPSKNRPLPGVTACRGRRPAETGAISPFPCTSPPPPRSRRFPASALRCCSRFLHENIKGENFARRKECPNFAP